jgi:hypothetical protein
LACFEVSAAWGRWKKDSKKDPEINHCSSPRGYLTFVEKIIFVFLLIIRAAGRHDLLMQGRRLSGNTPGTVRTLVRTREVVMKSGCSLSHRKFLLPVVVVCALLRVLVAYGQGTCPPPPFPPPPQVYHPTSGLAVGCPNGSIASIRSCSESDYNTNLSRFFGTLTFERLDITGNGVGFNLWWISQGNGDGLHGCLPSHWPSSGRRLAESRPT